MTTPPTEDSDPQAGAGMPDGTDATTDAGSSDPGASTKGNGGWKDDAQTSIDQASQALKDAWDATRTQRGSALEAAREATTALAAAIEEGIKAARGSWTGNGGGASAPGSDEAGSAPDEGGEPAAGGDDAPEEPAG